MAISFRAFLTILLTLVVASQIYWCVRGWRTAKKRIRSKYARIAVVAAVYIVYFAAIGFTFNWFGRRGTPIHLTPAEALLAAPILWWLPTSLVGFLVAVILRLVRGGAAAVAWAGRKLRPPEQPLASPGRRQFLEYTTNAVVAVPFLTGAYGLLYGRLNLETTRQPIRVVRLPRAFDGFRIAQLSDVHIGPFMPQEQIRRYVEIANGLKPDLIVLTGDFITWDPSTQQAVVRALAGLKAPYGVFGSLGNHETWSGTEDSIAALFLKAGIPILRHARVPITAHGESINLIGVDYDPGFHGMGRFNPQGYLQGVEKLIVPETANILLSHNPNTFDRAAELGIDLSLAGHTHGGQVSLEFISPNIAPSRLVTDYVAGWFGKPGGQLYVNRGIGTFGIPIRAGAPPEITVFELRKG